MGLANIENKIPNDTHTIFRAASITKQFTAVSILQLAEQGKLSLDDKLSNYFSMLPNSDKITIRNLLDHTSGLWEQEKDEDFPFPIDQKVPVDAHLSYIQKNKPFFEPGEKWRYCNNGYFLLGLVVEKVSGIGHSIKFFNYDHAVPCIHGVSGFGVLRFALNTPYGLHQGASSKPYCEVGAP